MTGGLQAVAVAFAAAVLIAAGAGQAAVSETPAPSVSSSGIPEIGRTRAIRLPCAVIRDLVAPSVGAAMDASALFEAAKTDLHKYGLIPGVVRPNAAAQAMALMRLDRKNTAIARDVATISKALGDARVGPNQSDPGAAELRRALQDLYAAENEKLNALSGFIEAERWNALFDEDESMSQMARARGNARRPNLPRALATPAAFGIPTPQPGSQVIQNPDAVAALVALASPPPEDRLAIDRASVAEREAAASKAITKIAETCR
jgi:hypothetical protein